MTYYVQCCHSLVWLPAWQKLNIQTNSLVKLSDRAGLPRVGNRRSFTSSVKITGQISGHLDCIVRSLTMFQHSDKVGITGMRWSFINDSLIFWGSTCSWMATASNTSWWGNWHSSKEQCKASDGLQKRGAVSKTALTNSGVYRPACVLTWPMVGSEPETCRCSRWSGWVAPGHFRRRLHMSAWVHKRRVLFLISLLCLYHHVQEHASQNNTCAWRTSRVHRTNGQIRIVPIAGWTRMLKQNPTTGIYLLLHELFTEGFRSFEDSFLLRTSWTGMRLEFKWNKPPASVQGGQTTNSSGGLSLSSFKTHSWLLVLLRSHPVHVSTESPLSPSFSTSGTKRGGQKTSTTAYFLPTGRPDTFFHLFPEAKGSVQIRREVPEAPEAPEGFCAIPEGPGTDTLWGSGGFRCRYLVRFRKFPVQVVGEVPEGYGADTWLGSRGFWCR